MRVIFHHDTGPELARRIQDNASGGFQVALCRARDDDRFRRLMTDADVLWHVLRPVTAADIEAAPRLRMIQKIGVGVNTIDLEAARARGISVCNMPGTNTAAVAELTLAHMLAVLRQLPAYGRAMRDGQGWQSGLALQERLGELGGRTVGLVGFGAVPRALAPVLKAMGSTVLYSSRSHKDAARGLAEWRPLPALLAESDIVSLHVPETPETRGMFGATEFARMKPGAVFVNTARGGLVDEHALARALANGRLRGAGLDVYADEPVETGNPLLALDNVVLTPHVAWLTMETIDRSLLVALDNCRRLAEGRPLRFQVV